MKTFRIHFRDGTSGQSPGRHPEDAARRLKRGKQEIVRYEEVVSNVTREGIEVRIGQVWEDCDKRCGGRKRVVAAVEAGVAHLQHWSEQGGASGGISKVAIHRMSPTSTGWKLFRDAP